MKKERKGSRTPENQPAKLRKTRMLFLALLYNYFLKSTLDTELPEDGQWFLPAELHEHPELQPPLPLSCR
jgi:hypothetical protein